MKNNKIISIIFVILFVIIIYNLFVLHDLKLQIYSTEDQLDKLISCVKNDIKIDLTTIKNNSYNILDKQANIHASINADINNSERGKLNLTIEAIPKDVNLHSDNVYAILETSNGIIKKQLEYKDDYIFIGEQVIPLCKGIDPTIVIESGNGNVKTQKLDYIDISELFTYSAYLEYSLNSDIESELHIYYKQNQNFVSSNFDNSNIVIYTKSGEKCKEINLKYNNEKSIEGNVAVYRTDKINFDIENDVEYEIFFEAEMNNGIKYKNKIANFSQTSQGGNRAILIPIF